MTRRRRSEDWAQGAVERARAVQEARGVPLLPEAIAAQLSVDADDWMAFARGGEAEASSPLVCGCFGGTRDVEAVRRVLWRAYLLCKQEMAQEIARQSSAAGLRFLAAHHFGYGDGAAGSTGAGVVIVEQLPKE